MKLSKAILKGYETNGGRQCVDRLLQDDGAMCVLGAYRKAVTGTASGDGMNWCVPWARERRRFMQEWGVDPVTLNNNYSERGDKEEPFPWEHIYGMARAAGL